jgi:hypothetical protein
LAVWVLQILEHHTTLHRYAGLYANWMEERREFIADYIEKRIIP